MGNHRKSQKKTKAGAQSWHGQWPREADIEAWMQAILATADFIDDADDRVSIAQHAIKELARTDHLDDAIVHLERLHQSIPAHDGRNRSWILKLGAELCFDVGRFDQMQEYLNRIVNLQSLFPRKVDRGCQEKSVREFKILRGLLHPRDAVDESERTNAALSHHLRAAKAALHQGDRAAAMVELDAVETLIPPTDDVGKRKRMEDLLRVAASADDRSRIRRLLAADERAGKWGRVNPDTLLEIGERDLAVARLETEIKEALRELMGDDMNAHFPAMAFEGAISALVDIGERATAQRWLRVALEEGTEWALPHRGAFSSAVINSVAKAVLRVEGPAPASQILELAMAHAAGDKPSGWRAAAMRNNLELLLELAGPEAALAEARKVRSPRDRRRSMVCLLAKSESWDKLHHVLREAADAKEAAELMWWIKFEWRPPKR